MAGIPVTPGDVQSTLGNAIRDVFHAMDGIKQAKGWMDDNNNAALVAIGVPDAEATQLRNAVNDMDQLRTLFEGTATLAVAKDFRNPGKKLIGIRY